MKERKRVVIIGAAPRKSYIIDENAIIVTANGAASIGNEYKSRFNNYVINIVGSGRLKEDLNVRNIISSSSADVLVVLGEKMSKNDIFFKQCKHKQIIFLSYKERFNLMRKTIGLFPALKSGVYEKNIKMFKKILISEILYPFQFKWCFLSTGLFSLLYALKKYGEEYDYILCGISFKGGKHFYDNKSMTSRRGKVDYSFIKSWKTISNYQIFTMDEISLDQIVPLKIEEKQMFFL